MCGTLIGWGRPGSSMSEVPAVVVILLEASPDSRKGQP
jgi:hypothetical protein